MFDWLGSGVLTIIAFLLVMGFVVVIHELGHYWAGRLCGVHAEAFSLGFGPTVFARPDRHGTVWKLSALPLGGFVQFRGDANAASAPDYETLAALREQHPEPETVLHFKPVWQRAFIVAAGPLANFALAIVLFAVLGAVSCALNRASEPWPKHQPLKRPDLKSGMWYCAWMACAWMASPTSGNTC